MVFSLILGGIFSPRATKADLLGDLFGNSVSASTKMDDQADTNSQNIGLLQANVSSASVLADKKSKNAKEDGSVDTTKDVKIVADTALVPATGPAGVSDGTDTADTSSQDVSVYVVRDGDTVAKIAEMYDVSPKTILWANDLKKGDKLVKDTILIILPVDGVQITVTKGQTLKSIATKYKVDATDIASFNGIAEDAQLAVGDELIIPDGTMTDEGGDKPIKNSSTNNKKSNYDTSKLANFTGYFMNPMPGSFLTQGLHDRGGIDLATSKGTPVLAAAAGTVIFASSGRNGGYGTMVMISHPNGTQTLYGHLSKITTSVGEKVSQGEMIGAEGNTGRSTGPHLHFKVIGARNPGAGLHVGSTVSANWKQ